MLRTVTLNAANEEVIVLATLTRAATVTMLLPLLLVAACTRPAATHRPAASVMMADCGGSLQAGHGTIRLAPFQAAQQPLGRATSAAVSILADVRALPASSIGPLERARTELLWGESLRRRRHRSAARAHLRLALEAFDQLGAHPWAAIARTELRATGETARARVPEALDRLTPQELQVARFVAEGATNREVAARMFISPRTVDHHLRNVFAKLGITSRAELIRHAPALP